MKQKSKTASQRVLLRGLFLLLFAVSFVLIVYERTKQVDELAQKNTTDTSVATVFGESHTQAGADFSAYRSTVIEVVTTLSQWMQSPEDITQAPAETAQALFTSLLETSVPSTYKNLHIRLVAIVRYFEDADSRNVSLIQEQYRLLIADYPWLLTLQK